MSTPSLLDVLHEVEAATGPLTTAELARRVGADPAVVAGMVEWLQRSGRLQPLACGPNCTPAACADCPLAVGPRPRGDRHYLPLRPVTRGRNRS